MNDRIQTMRNAVLADDHKARRTPFPQGEGSAFRDPILPFPTPCEPPFDLKKSAI